MIVKIGLVLIALVVVIVGACIIYGRSLVRSGRERKELHRRRVEDAKREELFSPEHRSKAAEEYRQMQKVRAEVGPIFNEEES